MSDHADPADHAALQPLLDVIAQASDPALRVAALDAAASFPLDDECWCELAGVARDMLHGLDPGSGERREALRVAVGIPLLSMRRQLRDMADDGGDPDAAHIAACLAAAGDPMQVWRLLAAVHGGDVHRLPELAAMPVEAAGVAAADIPGPDADESPDLLLWHAIVVARLGDTAALDAYLAGAVDPPHLFWGSPWSAYDRLAVVRPLPAALDAHLRHALAAVEQVQDGERRRMAQLIVWSCTGVADAEGTPLDSARGAPTPAPPRAGDAVPEDEAAAAAAHIVALMSDPAAVDEGPAPEALAKLAGLAPDAAGSLLVELIAGANRTMAESAAPDALQVALGNTIVHVIERLPVTERWPVREIAGHFLAPGRKALDVGQFAWVLSHLPARAVTSALAPDLVRTASPRDRRRLLELLGEVGHTQSGRAGSPWRGAGAGAAGVRWHALIDDEPAIALRAPIEVPGAPPAPSPGDAAGADASRSPSAEAAAGAADAADERQVNAQIWVRGERREAFLAGAENTIRCWIGLPEADRAAVSGVPVQHVAHIPDDGLELLVQLEWDGQTASARTRLPPGRTARTGDCDLTIAVPGDERYVKADVAFLYRGRVFEHVRMEAAALAAGEEAGPRDRLQVRVQTRLREVVELDERSHYDATLIYGAEADDDGSGPATLLEFGSQGVARYALDDTGTAVTWLNQELFIADKNLVRSEANARAGGGAGPRLAATDDEVLGILRQLAQHGAGFYNQLVAQRFVDPGRRLQLLNRTPKMYVPLEFVYDRGYPRATATLCDGWYEALSGDADECPCCGPVPPPHDAARDNTPTICPLGFWSLQKIIERLDPAKAAAGATGRSVPRNGRRELAPIERVVFGASHRVQQGDRDATVAALRRVAHVDLADDWPAWRSALALKHAPLLLALPHHGTRNNQDFLEIGGAPTPEADRELEGGRLTNLYVNPNSVDPGPIVLLIGCETGAGSATGYPALARSFQQLHTSIVVGTLAKVLGRHAAPVARELVTQLATVDDPDADFGTVMRRVRRRMLAKGYLMALCLVALGDADWRLARRGPVAARPPAAVRL